MKTGAVIAIVGGSVVVLGGGAYLLLRKPKPGAQSLCQKIAAAGAVGGGVAAGVPITPGIAQAAGGVACSILDQLKGALGSVEKGLETVFNFLPPVLLGKAALKVGEAAYETGKDVVTTTYHVAGTALDTSGHYIKVSGEKIYDGAKSVEHAAEGAVKKTGGVAKKVVCLGGILC